MSTIILVRPGSTDFDEQQRIQGTLDLPLNARGEQQVAQTLQDLQTIPLDVIYTSPSEPARTTAARLGEGLGVPVKELEDLRNICHGLWQGLHFEEVRRKHPKVFKQWQEAPDTICPPEGEMFADAFARVREALAKPLKSKKKANFAVVASEPIATIVACIVRGVVPADINPCGEPREKRWEHLKTNGTAPPVAAKAAVPTDVVASAQHLELASRGTTAHEFSREA